MIGICYYVCAKSVEIPAEGVGIFWDECGNRSRSDLTLTHTSTGIKLLLFGGDLNLGRTELEAVRYDEYIYNIKWFVIPDYAPP